MVVTWEQILAVIVSQNIQIAEQKAQLEKLTQEHGDLLVSHTQMQDELLAARQTILEGQKEESYRSHPAQA